MTQAGMVVAIASNEDFSNGAPSSPTRRVPDTESTRF
jgi:hypothetical protein